MSTNRSSSYSHIEDQQLCHVYIDVSQNPIIGKNQSRDKLWMRIETQYHADEPFKNQPRPRRSLESRMGIILKAISKLRGCVNQIVNKNPSGASEQDIIDQAKVLFAQDPNYNKGFVFEHVWNILKNVQKFSEVNQIPKSQQKANAFSPPLTPSTASGVPSLDLNEDVDIKFTERPIGVKKAKANLQNEKNMHNMLESNKQMCEALKIGNVIALKKLEAQNEKNRLVNETNRLTNITEENKILFTDLTTISDPEFLEYIQNEKKRIIRKRKAESQEEESRYPESQYRASQYQQDLENQSSPFQRSEEQDISEVQDQDQRPQEYSQYFHHLGGTVNDLNEC
ncbi:hypothetical protein LXL04_001926 [Taraxacum kok-saghyz]